MSRGFKLTIIILTAILLVLAAFLVYFYFRLEKNKADLLIKDGSQKETIKPQQKETIKTALEDYLGKREFENYNTYGLLGVVDSTKEEGGEVYLYIILNGSEKRAKILLGKPDTKLGVQYVSSLESLTGKWETTQVNTLESVDKGEPLFVMIGYDWNMDWIKQTCTDESCLYFINTLNKYDQVTMNNIEAQEAGSASSEIFFAGVIQLIVVK